MKDIKPKYKIKLNSSDELEALLQELYDETCMNIKEIQNEINKLTQSTDLSLEIMDAKAKYAKAVNDYSTNKNKALATKMDIAKMMVEVIKHNGDTKKTILEMENVPTNWGDEIETVLQKVSNPNKTNIENDNKKVYKI